MTDKLIYQAEIDAYNASTEFLQVEPDPIAQSVQIQDNPGTPAPPMEVVQTFSSDGIPQKPIDTEAQRKQNFEKAFSGQPADVQGSGTGGETTISPDMVAMKQKGILQEKGFFGDQSMTNENKAFDNVTSIAAAATGIARTVAAISASKQTSSRHVVNNYYLYDNEKTYLRQRASEIASIGVVPYDVAEEFLYILVTIDNAYDLYYISTVVGIPQLDNPNIIRSPMEILSISNLYRVGYLANAVASINMQYSTKYNAISAADHKASPYATVMGVAQAVQLAAAAGRMLNLPLGQFPIVNIATSMVGDIAKQIALTTAITSLPTFGGSSFSSLPQVGKLAQMAQLQTIAGQVSNLNSMVSSTSSIMQKSGVGAMGPIMQSLGALERQSRELSRHSTQVSGIATIAATSAKTGDIGNQMTKIAEKAIAITSLVSTITSLLSAIKSPGNVGAAASIQTTKLGGTSPSGIITELTLGQRIPPSVLYKNPMMMPPGYTGKAFFGEHPAPHGAVDQMFCKRIAAYPKENCGSGNQSFGMQNFGSMGGSTSLINMVSNIVLGTQTPPTVGILAVEVARITNNVCNILNVPTTSAMEARRSDNSLPFMTAMGAALVNDTVSPFPIDVHNEGWKLASSVGNDVQKYNPNFLSTCVSSL
jgi:hypothetical protein